MWVLIILVLDFLGYLTKNNLVLLPLTSFVLSPLLFEKQRLTILDYIKSLFSIKNYIKPLIPLSIISLPLLLFFSVYFHIFPLEKISFTDSILFDTIILCLFLIVGLFIYNSVKIEIKSGSLIAVLMFIIAVGMKAIFSYVGFSENIFWFILDNYLVNIAICGNYIHLLNRLLSSKAEFLV